MNFEEKMKEICDCKQAVSKNLHTIATINAQAKSQAMPIGIENAQLEDKIKVLEKEIFAYAKEHGLSEMHSDLYNASLEINYSLKFKPVVKKA